MIKNTDYFFIKIGVDLLLKGLAAKLAPLAFLFKGPLSHVTGWFLEKIFLSGIELGILRLDIYVIKKKVMQQKEDYTEDIRKAFQKATKGVLTEDEKKEIRKEYAKILTDFISVHDSLRDQ